MIVIAPAHIFDLLLVVLFSTVPDGTSGLLRPHPSFPCHCTQEANMPPIQQDHLDQYLPKSDSDWFVVSPHRIYEG